LCGALCVLRISTHNYIELKYFSSTHLCERGLGELDGDFAAIVHQRSNADRFSRDVASPVKGDAAQDGPRREAGYPESVLDFTPEGLLKNTTTISFAIVIYKLCKINDMYSAN
jgi:hypothetical protein